MTEEVLNTYEVVTKDGLVWDVPYARLEDATPTVSNPAAVLARIVGTQITGVIVAVDATDSIATIDFSCGSVRWYEVRNVLTYNAGVAELTWGAINIGDPVYYDRSASMPAGVYLSTSPLDFATGAANPLFGYIAMHDDVDAALFPKGGATASTQDCAVIQRGAGA